MRRTFLLLLSAFVALGAHTGVAFLKVPVDAQVCGMGEAAAAGVDNTAALYYNAAGLAGIESFSALFMHNEWLLGMNQEFAAVGYGTRELGTFGLSFSYWGSGDIPGLTFRGETIPGYYFAASDWCLNLGYGRTFGPLSAGAGFKYVSELNESLSTSAIAFDAGGMYRLPIDGLKAGLSVANLGTKAKLDQESYVLPLTARIGWRFDWRQFGIAHDFIVSEAEKPGIAAGGEYRVADILALRLGYRTGSNTEGLSGLRAGLGVSYRGFGIDYALAPYGRLGMTHRISVAYRAKAAARDEAFD